MTRVVWNEPALLALLESPEGEVARDLLRRAINVESQAKLNASGQPGPRVQTGRLRASQAKLNASGQPGPRVQTGRLRASITHQLDHDDAGLVARIGSNVEYARYVEEGTEPHRIVARRKKALHWKGARHPVFAVNHPGTRARPYLRPALVAASL